MEIKYNLGKLWYGWVDLEFRKIQDQESSNLDEKWKSYGLWKFDLLKKVI